MLKNLIYILFMVTFGLILSSCGGNGGNNSNNTPSGTFTVALVSPVPGSTSTSTMPVVTLSTSQTVAQNSSGGLASGSITLTTGSATGAAIPISAININNSASGSTITFSPTIALTAGSTYFVNVTNITSISGAIASLSTNNTFISGSSLTLSVAVTSPINGATNVALSSSIQIQSSLPLNNTSSISTSNLSVTSSNSTTPIAGTFLFSNNNTVVTFTPASPLFSNTIYTVTVSGLIGISGSSTVSMSGNVTSNFTTAYKILAYSATSPTTDSLNSSDGVNWNIGLSSISLSQFLIPYSSNPSNIVCLATGIGGSGAALTSNLSTFQMIKFKYNMSQWATNGNGTIVGVGLVTAGSAAGLIYSTNGGISWTAATIPGFIITARASIAYGNGGFLAISDNAGAGTGLVASSANGYVWTVSAAGFQASFPTTPVIAFVNGYFVTADGAAGTNHITYYTNSPFSAFVSSGQNINDTSFGIVTAIGGGQLGGVNYWYFGTAGGTAGSELAYSTTPTTSLTQAAVGATLFGGTGASSSPVNTIIFGNNTFVAGARGAAGTTNLLAFSTNGTTWTPVTTPSTLLGALSTTTVNSIAFGGANGSTFVAVSNNTTAAYSTANPMTASSWSSATITGIPASINFTLSIGAAINGISGVINVPSTSGAATNTFVTGGAFSIPLVSTAATPAFSYTGGISIPSNSIASTTLGGVPMQIAVGNVGVINYSINNGVTWTSVTSGTIQNLNSIACGSISGSNICVAVGNGGVLLSSTNGTTWTLQSSGTGQNLNTIIFANNMFVAGGGANSGGLLPVVTSSLNGTSWTAQTIGSTTNLGIWSIAFGVVGTTPTFVAVGGNGSSNNGLPVGGTTGFIAYNTSAATGIGAFTAVTNYTGAFLSSVAFASTGTGNQATFVAVGGAAATAVAISSTSGISWANTPTTLTSSNFPAGSITYAGGSNWVAGTVSNASLNNANMFVSSDNANTWVAVGLPFAPTVTNGVSINALTYIPSLGIIVAAYNAPAGATSASVPISFTGILVASSSNLFQWSAIPSLQYLAYGALNRFITF